ncbi:sel1 repeat family protein [Chelativorans sp. Marseille-P2723]|uniref:sel1 repeat family protein n=1 Tax=Chelativorans sp. Marseille-P2723 TaxID=2709133 RepID=UPI00156D7997|nr:sel1 repeat family protein [Chelativorans sp. Marseille-P2723]
MAQAGVEEGSGSKGGNTEADLFFRLGMMYARGSDCEVDLVAAHKWLNIAAIKGSDRAAMVRAKIASSMTKGDIARALREARKWMTMH